MRQDFRRAALAWLALATQALLATAQNLATVNHDHVNVRGQPSLTSEVITQLRQDEVVTVLGEVAARKPEADEPDRWAKILLPSDTPVWVFARSVDPSTLAVRTPRLNVRAGPGLNFSILGTLRKGATVKQIRVLEDWMEVEAPTNTFAYVAAEFLSRSGAKPEGSPRQAEPRVESKTQPVAAPAIPAPEPAVGQPTAVAPPSPDPSRSAAVPAAVPAGQRTDLSAPATPAAPSPTAPTPAVPPPATPAERTAPSEPAAAEDTKPSKRIVSHEGIVRDTTSIQAPTLFELRSPETGRLVNWLLPAAPDIDIRKFKGLRVVVTGEEQMEPRWKTTPMMEVQRIELAP